MYQHSLKWVTSPKALLCPVQNEGIQSTSALKCVSESTSTQSATGPEDQQGALLQKADHPCPRQLLLSAPCRIIRTKTCCHPPPVPPSPAWTLFFPRSPFLLHILELACWEIAGSRSLGNSFCFSVPQFPHAPSKSE